jgi:hypothetical protein
MERWASKSTSLDSWQVAGLASLFISSVDGEPIPNAHLVSDSNHERDSPQSIFWECVHFVLTHADSVAQLGNRGRTSVSFRRMQRAFGNDCLCMGRQDLEIDMGRPCV